LKITEMPLNLESGILNPESEIKVMEEL
jgi:hypothetical protein